MITATTIYKNSVSALLPLLTLAILTIGMPALATATPTISTCTHFVRECLLTETSGTRASCFASTSKTPACANSVLGGIAALRANVAPLGESQVVLPVTELGQASTSNFDCLRNFDTLLASTLIYEEPSENELRRLIKILRFCVAGPLNTSR